MRKLIPSLAFILFLSTGCKQSAKVTSPPGYDLASPGLLKMPGVLNEISGIAFNAGNPDTLYAQQDEEGRLFYFPVAAMDVKHTKFGKKGDYEDIAICNGRVFILRSDGTLFSFPLNTGGGEEISDVQETGGVLPAGEYEGMYGDEATGSIYVLCKDCKGDNAAKSISGYVLQWTNGKGIELKSNFQVNTTEIAEKMNDKKILFRPSALAKSKVTNEWYLVSSVNKLLVTAGEQWAIKEVYALDPALFPQPEGIAFDRDNNLYISNERGSFSNATVLKFTFAKVN